MARVSEDEPVPSAGTGRERAALPSEPVRTSMPRPSAEKAEALATRLGFDVADLDRNLAKYQAQFRATAAKQIEAAVKGSKAGSAKLAAILNAMSADAVFLSGSNAAPGSEFSSVDVPSNIFTNGGLQLDATGIVTFDSFAKVIRPPSGSIDHQEVLFSFPYANTTNLDQVITVNGVVGLNGVVGAGDDGGWTVFGHDHNTLRINAIMRMFADTDDNQGLGLLVDSWPVLSIDAYEDSWPQSVGAIVSQTLVRGTALGTSDVLVKAGRSRIFDIGFTFDSSPPGGNTSFDFSSGDFKVSGFGLFVHVTS
jgi:hypothetical protein